MADQPQEPEYGPWIGQLRQATQYLRASGYEQEAKAVALVITMLNDPGDETSDPASFADLTEDVAKALTPFKSHPKYLAALSGVMVVVRRAMGQTE